MLIVDELQTAFDEFTLSANFQVAPGEILVITGASGSGKTTLLELIAGFVPVESGRIQLHGGDVTTKEPSQRDMMTVFQSDNDFNHLTVMQNVLLGITPKLAQLPKYKQTVRQAIETVGLKGFEKRLPSQLSGGQRQRIALARNLVSKRSVWLLDEPFAALGPRLRQELLQLIRKMTDEKQLMTLLVTHQPQEMRIADRLLLLEQGQIRLLTEINEVLDNPPASLEKYLAVSG